MGFRPSGGRAPSSEQCYPAPILITEFCRIPQHQQDALATDGAASVAWKIARQDLLLADQIVRKSDRALWCLPNLRRLAEAADLLRYPGNPSICAVGHQGGSLRTRILYFAVDPRAAIIMVVRHCTFPLRFLLKQVPPWTQRPQSLCANANPMRDHLWEIESSAGWVRS